MVSKKERDALVALADLDPELVAMLSVQDRIANDPTRIPGIHQGQVLQGIQDYTGRQSQAGIISDARNMSPEEFQRQFGISNVYTRALADAQDAARRGDARAMPDSEARAERERQSIESLQSQIAANVAEQQRQNALRQKLLDDLNFSELRATTGQGPSAGRAAAGTADYTQPLPEGTGWWDETAAKITQREAREINEKFGTYFKSAGLPPITSLDEFLNLVREERAQNPGGERGIFGVIYGDQFPLDNWGIFGPPQITDPLAGNIPGTSANLPLLQMNPELLMNQAQTGASWLMDLLRNSGAAYNPYGSMGNMGTYFPPDLFSGLTDYYSIGGYSMPPRLNYEGMPPSTGRALSAARYPMFPVPPTPGTNAGPSPDPDATKPEQTAEQTFDEAQKMHSLMKDIDPQTLNTFNNIARDVIKTGSLDKTMGLIDDPNWPLSDQFEDIQNLMQSVIYQRQQGIVSEAAELDMIMQVIDRARAERQLEFQQENAERDYNLARSRLQLDAVKAIDEGRQFDETLAFEERQAASALNQANAQLDMQQRQMQLERYQTDVANPFNVAAMNLLSAPSDVRAYQGAQQQNVDEGALSRALQTAQFHSGRQGLGADDPQVQQMAAQLVPQMTTPRERAAMQAIAQGVSSMAQMPEQQMAATATGAPQLPQLFNLQPGTQMPTTQAQTMPQYAQQMEGAERDYTTPSPSQLPGPLSALGMTIPQNASFGQPMNIQEFFKGGMPTVAQVTNLPEVSQRTLGALGESVAQSPSDIMQAASMVTPQVANQPASRQPTLRRLLPRAQGR